MQQLVIDDFCGGGWDFVLGVSFRAKVKNQNTWLLVVVVSSRRRKNWRKAPKVFSISYMS